MIIVYGPYSKLQSCGIYPQKAVWRQLPQHEGLTVPIIGRFGNIPAAEPGGGMTFSAGRI